MNRSITEKFRNLKKSNKVVLLLLVALVAFSVYRYINRNPSADIEDAGVEIVRARLVDPDSAKFKNVYYKEGVGICGQVNSKNRMGGYVGFKSFVVEASGLVLMEGPELQKYQREIVASC